MIEGRDEEAIGPLIPAPGERVDDGHRSARSLELDVHPDATFRRVQYLVESRDALAAPRIQSPNLLEGHAGEPARSGRRSIDTVVVHDHEASFDEMHVDLHGVGVERDRALHGRERVLGCMAPRSAMTDDEHLTSESTAGHRGNIPAARQEPAPSKEDPMKPNARLGALRKQMRKHDLAGYLVPSTDPHQSEYVPAVWQRRAWLSGFTGSAGDVVVFARSAGLFTDGRYFVQAARQLAGSGITLFRLGEPKVPSLNEHVKKTLRAGEALGVDSRVVSRKRVEELRRALEAVGARLELMNENLVDAVWTDRPRPEPRPIRTLPVSVTGASTAKKLASVRKALRERDADALVIPAPDDIAWLFNFRGADVEFNPLAIAYAVLTATDATLFIDPAKVPDAAAKILTKSVAVRAYDEIEAACRALGRRGARVWIDDATANEWLFALLDGAAFEVAHTPIPKLKSKKNDVEIRGTRDAHVRDGVAMVRFLHWLENAVGREVVTEITAAEKLAALRAEGKRFEGLSFRTISGYGEHGAVIHYSVTDETDVPLRRTGLYLVDSGAHYTDGTTDITRTVLLGGRAPRAQKERFTRVLQGHIALARAVFPSGVDGVRLDTLARQPLWEVGLGYNHGTGHGVGFFMNVHEGPQSIGTRATGAALEPGNLLSNEPGYYEEGEYGIRIENLMLVVEDASLSCNGTRFHRFETVSRCPIDTRLLLPKLLTADERAWLNAYHRDVRKKLSPHLEPDARRWLAAACRAV